MLCVREVRLKRNQMARMKLNPRALTFRLSALALCDASMRKSRRCDDDRTVDSRERDMKRRKVIIYILILSFLLLALGGLDACWTFHFFFVLLSLMLRDDDDIKYKYVIITNWSCVSCETSHCMRLDFINCRYYLKTLQPKLWMEIYQIQVYYKQLQ